MLKNLFSIALLLLIFSVVAFAQTKSNDQIEKQIKNLNAEKNIKLSYDEAGATSKIFVTGEDFGSKPDAAAKVEGFSFGMAFFYAGKVLINAPDEINLTFWVLTKKPKFAEAHSLKIFVGNQVFDLGEARYAAKPTNKMEYLNFKIPRQTLAEIAQATTAKIKIGNAEFEFTPVHLKTFANLLKISDPTIF